MLQRVQTVWMLLAAIAVFLTLKLSFYSGTLIADNTYHHLLAIDNFLLMVLTSALGSAIVINIFLFNYRIVQLRICIVAIIAECLVILLYIIQLKKFSTGTFDLWSAFHIITLIALIMAAIGINKDEKLIKDSNRLR